MQIRKWTAKTSYTNEYWIALKYIDTEGVWKWDEKDGLDLKNNKKWKWWREGEQKNNDENKNCAAVGGGGTDVREISCNEEKPVLCVRCKLFLPVVEARKLESLHDQ